MKRAFLSAVATVVVVGLGACTTLDQAATPSAPPARYTLQVEPGVDRIALAVHDTGLSPNQQAALAGLADRFRSAGGSQIRLEAPVGADAAATEAAVQVMTALVSRGVPASAIERLAYAAPDPRAPVLAGFAVPRAHVPTCGQSWSNLASNRANQPPANFGCAVTANMAAQIADPRDIVAPRAMTLADSYRAAVVFQNYRLGQTTSATQEPLITGRVALAVE